MINVAVCDDNLEILNILKKLLKRFTLQNSDIHISFSFFSDGNKLINSEENYTIFLLDIEIGDINGIDLAKQIQKRKPEAIIFFITSHDSFLDDALDTRPFRYLRKPIEEKRLFDGIIAALNHLSQLEANIAVHSKKDIIKVKTNDIVYITIENRKTTIIKKDETLVIDDKFSDIQEMLSDKSFVSSHKSFFVNLEFVHSFNTKNVILKNGDNLITVDMSRRNYKGFNDKFFDYVRSKN